LTLRKLDGGLKVNHQAQPDQCLEQAELARAVARILSGLSARERSVLSLYFWDEHTLAQIGKTFGVTDGRISGIKRKALQKLRHPRHIALLATVCPSVHRGFVTRSDCYYMSDIEKELKKL